MNPTHFPESNFRLLAPPSMPECLPLSCHRYPATPEGPGGYISRWEPTPEERAAIAAGGPVWVYVVGDGAPPPIAVSGLSPFETAYERAKRAFTAAEWALAFNAYERATGKPAGSRGRAGETLTAAEVEEHKALAEELDSKVFQQMEVPLLTRTDATPCLFCGQPYGDHADAPLAMTPRVPCLGEKAHFVDARLGEKSPE